MKAKELAEILMKNPDLDVVVMFGQDRDHDPLVRSIEYIEYGSYNDVSNDFLDYEEYDHDVEINSIYLR